MIVLRLTDFLDSGRACNCHGNWEAKEHETRDNDHVSPSAEAASAAPSLFAFGRCKGVRAPNVEAEVHHTHD